jgi:hypothetical protein
MEENKKVENLTKNFKDSLLIIRNIVEASSPTVNRFQFTPTERSALTFVVDLLSSNIAELE